MIDAPTPAPGNPPAGPPWPVPAVEPEIARITRIGKQKRRNRHGGALLAGACALYLLSIPLALFLLKGDLEQAAHRSVDWGEIFYLTQRAGLAGLLVLGVLGVVTLVVITAGGAVLVSRNNPTTAIAMVLVGTVGLLFSLLIFGLAVFDLRSGLVAALGAALSMAGGLTTWPRKHRPLPAYPMPSWQQPPAPP